MKKEIFLVEQTICGKLINYILSITLKAIFISLFFTYKLNTLLIFHNPQVTKVPPYPYVGLFNSSTRTVDWPNTRINYNFCNSFFFFKLIIVMYRLNNCIKYPTSLSSVIGKKNITLNPSTQKLCKKQNSSFGRDKKIHPSFVTGFVDGEGCFTCSITENKKLKVGWTVKPCFKIGLHVKDKDILRDIQITLGVGKINEQGPQVLHLRIQSPKELESVINHLDKFPLLTKKRADFELLKRIYIKIKRKEHLTSEGLRKIVTLKAAMNLGLSEKLNLAFPDIVPAERPLHKLPKTVDPH